MKYLALFGAIFATLVFAENTSPTLSCMDQNYAVNLDSSSGALMLSIASIPEDTPVLPSLDPRIRSFDVGPMPCAETLGHAMVCYTNVCYAQQFYDFSGNLLTDVTNHGDVMMTVLPDESYSNGSLTQVLKLHFEFSDPATGVKHTIDNSFEIFPGNFCSFSSTNQKR